MVGVSESDYPFRPPSVRNVVRTGSTEVSTRAAIYSPVQDAVVRFPNADFWKPTSTRMNAAMKPVPSRGTVGS